MAGSAETRLDASLVTPEPQAVLRRRKSDMMLPYVRGAALSVALIWAFVAIYLALVPRTYVSRWVLNLPGAASSVSLSLESIGQSSSTPNSPFSSSALSPKVVYREIAEGERVRATAADALGLDRGLFAKPRVKLIDETALMLFEITASSPGEAKRRSEALLVAFNAELDSLRNDELQKRESAVRANLAGYQAQVRLVRDKTMQAQRETGLVSITQYAEMVTSLTNVRRRLVDLSGETNKLAEEQARLSVQLGVSAHAAEQSLKLAAEPSLQKALTEYNDASTLFADIEQRFGAQHPQYVAASQRRDAAQAQFNRIAGQILPGETGGQSFVPAVAIVNASPRAELYQTLVRNDAMLQGKRREVASLMADRDQLELDVNRLSTAASRLEDLKKDQIVADAVFSTAMARLDSSKSDIYGSYPIVQVVSPPDLPNAAAQPRPLYAALGGASGTFFACLAWMLAWLQFAHRVRRRKST